METRQLIQQLQANMVQLQQVFAQGTVPHFGQESSPECDEILMSASSTPHSNVQFVFRPDESPPDLYTTLVQKLGSCTLRGVISESKHNQELRSLIGLKAPKLCKRDVCSIFPMNLDRSLTPEEFNTFVKSAREFLKPHELKFDVYAREDKTEVQVLESWFEEWSERQNSIEKSRVLALLEMNRSKVQRFIDEYIHEEGAFETIRDKIMDSFEDVVTKKDFLGFFDLYPSSATFTPRVELSQEDIAVEGIFKNQEGPQHKPKFGEFDEIMDGVQISEVNQLGWKTAQECKEEAKEPHFRVKSKVSQPKQSTAPKHSLDNPKLTQSAKVYTNHWDTSSKHWSFAVTNQLKNPVKAQKNMKYSLEDLGLGCRYNFEEAVKTFRLTPEQRKMWEMVLMKLEREYTQHSLQTKNKETSRKKKDPALTGSGKYGGINHKTDSSTRPIWKYPGRTIT